MAKRLSKKDLAISMKAAGRSVEEIARTLDCSASYVSNVLIGAGQATEYTDLYTSSIVQNEYARMFSGVLRFRNPDAAKGSVQKIDALYHQFVDARDRRGQHQAQLMALIGKNRAEGIGKLEEAKLFRDWLVAHLDADIIYRGDELAGSSMQETLDLSPYEVGLAMA